MRQQLIKLDRLATQLVTLLLVHTPPSVQQGQLMTLGIRLQQQQQQQPTQQQQVPTQVVLPQPLTTMVMAEPLRQQLLQQLQPMTLPRLTTHNHQLQLLILLLTHITKVRKWHLYLNNMIMLTLNIFVISLFIHCAYICIYENTGKSPA